MGEYSHVSMDFDDVSYFFLVYLLNVSHKN